MVYVGRAGKDVGGRIGDFYATPLGDPRPHAGGHWLKTLSVLAGLEVWWAESGGPTGSEADLLAAFAAEHGAESLPFANRETAAKMRKSQSIAI